MKRTLSGKGMMRKLWESNLLHTEQCWNSQVKRVELHH